MPQMKRRVSNDTSSQTHPFASFTLKNWQMLELHFSYNSSLWLKIQDSTPEVLMTWPQKEKWLRLSLEKKKPGILQTPPTNKTHRRKQLPQIYSPHQFSLLAPNRPLQPTPKNSSSLFRLRMPTSNSSMMFKNATLYLFVTCLK